MALRGDTDDFFSRIWDKFVEYFGYTLVTIIIFFSLYNWTNYCHNISIIIISYIYDFIIFLFF